MLFSSGRSLQHFLHAQLILLFAVTRRAHKWQDHTCRSTPKTRLLLSSSSSGYSDSGPHHLARLLPVVPSKSDAESTTEFSQLAIARSILNRVDKLCPCCELRKQTATACHVRRREARGQKVHAESRRSTSVDQSQSLSLLQVCIRAQTLSWRSHGRCDCHVSDTPSLKCFGGLTSNSASDGVHRQA